MKQLPSAPEVEFNVLGEMLLDPVAMDEAMRLLIPESFFQEENRIIFLAMRELYKLGNEIDSVTIYQQLKKEKQLDNIGGPEYLSKLGMMTFSSARIIEHCKILTDKWMLRKEIELSRQTENAALQDEDPFELLHKMNQKAYEIENNIESVYDKDRNLGESIDELLIKVDEKYSGKTEMGLLTTSFPTFNTATGGIMPTDYIIVYGTDKSGKTTFTHRLCLDLALQGKNIGIFSLEMDFEQVALKNIAMFGNIEYLKLRNPKRPGNELSVDEFKAFATRIKKIRETNIWIDDKTFNFDRIISKCRLWKRKHNIDFLVIDYIGLLESNIKTESVKYLFKYYSRRIKQLAKELNTPIILVSQANDYEKTADSIDLLRDCDFAIRIIRPIEAGIENLKDKKTKQVLFTFEENHFLVILERSRHGINKQKFICGFVDNNFVELHSISSLNKVMPNNEYQNHYGTENDDYPF